MLNTQHTQTETNETYNTTWQTDLFTFVAAVNGVLTAEQRADEENATEAAIAYCLTRRETT